MATKFAFYRLVYILLLCCQIPVLGQLTVERKLNIPMIEEKNNEVEIIPLGEEGLFFLQQQSDNLARRPYISVMKLDTSLSMLYSKGITLDPLFTYKNYYLTPNHLFVLAENTEATDFRILRFDRLDGDVISFEGRYLTQPTIEFFKVVSNKVWLGGTYNDRAVIEQHNLLDKTAKIIPNLYANDLQLSTIEPLPDNTNTLVVVRDTRRCQQLHLVYDYDGRLVSSTTIGDESRMPISSKLMKFEKQPILIGTYSDNCSQFAVGLYVNKLSENTVTDFFPFTSISNFLNHLPDKKKEKLRKRISEGRAKGKEVKLRHRMLLHSLEPTQNGWLLVGEVFYPEYTNQRNALITNDYRLYRMGSEFYNQFHFTHAIVAELDDSGKILWGNSIPLKNQSSRTLDEVVQVTPTPDGFAIAYPERESIRVGHINQDNKLELQESLDLRLTDPNEKSYGNAFSPNLLAWHTTTFLAHGFQRKSIMGGPEKEYYVIQKYTYRPKSPATAN